MKRILRQFIGPDDLIAWTIVIVFFLVSAFLFSGTAHKSILWSLAIIALMVLIALSIKTILESLQGLPYMGAISGVLTNGPELVCVIVGTFLTRDMLFAASTPLGSNFINPFMLICASLITLSFPVMMKTSPKRTWSVIFITAFLAAAFFLVPAPLSHVTPLTTDQIRFIWLVAAVIASAVLLLFFLHHEVHEREPAGISRWWILPALLILTISGYFLDYAVGQASLFSKAPKGVIGFFVLSFLSSWPEFKATTGLLKKKRVTGAINNILVSNLTNILLGILAVVLGLLLHLKS